MADAGLEHGRRLLAIEVKLAERVGYADAASLRAFLGEHPRAVTGLLLYAGDEVIRLGERVVACPWTTVAG